MAPPTYTVHLERRADCCVPFADPNKPLQLTVR